MSCTGNGCEDRVPRTARLLAPTPAPARPRARGSPQQQLPAPPAPRTPALAATPMCPGSRESEGRRCDSPPRPLPASVSPPERRQQQRRQRLPSARLPLDSTAARRAPLPCLARCRPPRRRRSPSALRPRRQPLPGGWTAGMQGGQEEARGLQVQWTPCLSGGGRRPYSHCAPLVLATAQGSSQAALVLSKGCHLFACSGRRRQSFNRPHLL